MSAPLVIKTLWLRAQAAAPKHPPCFASQDDWVEYVAWSMAAQDAAVKAMRDTRNRDRTPGDTRLGFNRGMTFCADCTASHAAAMKAAGRCKPNWLKEPTTAEEAAA